MILANKTIKSSHWYHDRLILVFTDGTYCKVAREDDEFLQVADRLSTMEKYECGIIDIKEMKTLVEVEREVQDQRILAKKTQEYEQLKKELGL